jgi:hypothetical protein
MDVTTLPKLLSSESGKLSANYEFALRQETY